MDIVEIVKQLRRYENNNRITDLNNMIQMVADEEEFNLFFEMYENSEVTVFANLYAFDMEEDDYERLFHIETAIVVKDLSLGEDYVNNLFYLQDNDLYRKEYAEILQTKPVWKMSELSSAGVIDFKEARSSFPLRYLYEWNNLNEE